MPLHPSTFEYLKPTGEQLTLMDIARTAAANYATVLEGLLPDGPDKTYTLRKLREVGMWANIAITRHPDGAPRGEAQPPPGRIQPTPEGAQVPEGRPAP